jgi:hypothetical protein
VTSARRSPSPVAFAIAAASLLLLVSWTSSASAAYPRPSKICAACHGTIQKAWSASVKAKSWTNPVFQAFLADAQAARGEKIRMVCLSCHAPQAAVAGNPAVDDPVEQEGVTCNFCHNVSSVEVSDRPASYTHDPSNPNLMRGPYTDSDPGSAHDFQFNETFTKGDFCSACHWAKNEKGVEIEGTYPQWKSSKASAAGKQCQTCHMPPAPGKASPLSKKQRDAVYAHTFLGPRVPGGLDSVVTLSGAVSSGKLKLTIQNVRAGHALPGGARSMRSITLEVSWLDAAGKELSRTTVDSYGTEFADSTGKSPVPKWLAASVKRTNEIPADSSVEEWADPVPGAKSAEAILTYQPILPAYRAALVAKQVDLTGRDPVVLARTTVKLP